MMIKTLRTALPFITVIFCILCTLANSSSYALQERIYSLHHDPFTIERSLNGLRLASTLIPAVLALSLLLQLSLVKTYVAAEWRWQWQRNYCLVALLFTISLSLRLWQCPLAQDDSYIDYRYVQHWLTGQFDYNSGEHVMGFTSHLHLLTLWAVCLLSRSNAVDLVSYYLNCGVDTFNTLFLFFVMVKIYGRTLPAFIASLCYAVSSYNCSQTIAGKETALVNFVLLLAIYCMKTSRTAMLPWCANALFLFRPEGIIACLITLATTLQAKGREALKSFIVPCGITCALYAFLLIYFGSILPHGMIAKHKVLLPGDFFSVFMGCISLAGNVMTNSTFFLSLPGLEAWPFFATTLLLFAYSFWRFKEPSLALYRNIALAQLILLAVVQSRVFSWYFCWFALLIPIVMAQMTADAFAPKEGKHWVPVICFRAVVVFLLLAYLRTGFFFAPYAWIPYLERGVAYREAALFIQEKGQGKALAASSDIGILGYYYTGPVLDLMGLISCEPLKYYPIKNNPGLIYLIPPKAVSDFKPKYLMAPFGHVYGMLLNDEDFKSHYTELKTWTNPAMTDGIVTVWERNEEPPASDLSR
jgi:hypothetical protein